MKGRKLFWRCVSLLLFCSITFIQLDFYSKTESPLVSGDEDSDEKIIDLGQVEFKETWNGLGYFYQLNFTLKYDDWEYEDEESIGFVGFGWTVGTNIYSYFDLITVTEIKQGKLNFTTYEPISSCFTFRNGRMTLWRSEDHKPISSSIAYCAIPVEDIFNFDFKHFIFTDYAMYAIRYDVTFSILANQTLSSGFTSAFGNIRWDIDRVAIFKMISDPIISQINITTHACFSIGDGQNYAPTTKILTNGTQIPCNGTIETLPTSSSEIDEYFPHQFYYYLDLDCVEAGVRSCPIIAFVPPEYFSSPTPSEWSLLPGWAKFTIIGGSISLLGCAAFTAQFVITLLKRRKLG